jgi:hypothetical protein
MVTGADLSTPPGADGPADRATPPISWVDLTDVCGLSTQQQLNACSSQALTEADHILGEKTQLTCPRDQKSHRRALRPQGS